MNDVQDTPGEIKKKNNTTLWVMVIIFCLPYVFAFYFYFNKAELGLKQSNYGTIISPARQIPDVNLTKLDDSKLRLSSLKGKWIIFSIGSSLCKQDCIDNLYKIRQINKAVGKIIKE